MTDPGRQRETKYLTINRPCAYIHFSFKAVLVCILIKVIAELCFLGIFFLIFYLSLKSILLGVNYITVLLSVSQVFLEFVYDLVLFYWHLGVERHTAGYVLFVVETVHQLVGHPSLRISQLYRTVPSVFECKRTDDTTKKRSYPKYL